MNIDGIIMNRVLPDEAGDGYFRGWRAKQKHYMELAETYFAPVPIFPVRLFRAEVLGYDRLRELAEQLYGGKDPLMRFFKGEPYSLTKEDGRYRLVMRLPFVEKKSIELNKVADELIVRVGTFKRHIMLPRQVAAFKTIRAKMEGANLCIDFKGDDHGEK
jgi:arsenite-transporting ATPase